MADAHNAAAMDVEFPQYRDAPLVVKSLILKACTASDILSYDRLLNGSVAATLNALTTQNYRPSIRDLISLHFREEARIFPQALALDYLNNHRVCDVQASTEIQDFTYIGGVLTQLQYTQEYQHLFFLSAMSQRATAVIDTIVGWTDIETDQQTYEPRPFSRQDYYNLLRIWRMCGSSRGRYQDLQEKFNYFGSLDPEVRNAMNELINRISDAYARDHRTLVGPLGPGMGTFSLHYSSALDRDMIGHIDILPWPEFVDTGLYSIAIKHWLLSTSYEAWFDSFPGDPRTRTGFSTAYQVWSQELYFGRHRMVFERSDPTEDWNVRGRPGDRATRDDGSMYYFVLANRCAAFEHACNLRIGESLAVGVEGAIDPILRPADMSAGLYTWIRERYGNPGRLLRGIHW